MWGLNKMFQCKKRYQVSVSCWLWSGFGVLAVLSHFGLEAVVSAHAEELEVKVRARRKKMKTTSAVSYTEVATQELKQLPQGGEASLSKILSNTLPGIVLGPFGQLFFRGNHGSVQYQLDGVPLPETPSQALGKWMNPHNLENIEVLTGGFPAEYGWRLGGVVQLTPKKGSDQSEGEVGLGYGSYQTLAPHLLYGGSDDSGRLRYFLSTQLRKTERGLDTPQPESETQQKQGGRESVHNQALSHAEFLKLDWQPNTEHDFSFLFSASYSRLQLPNYPTSWSYDRPYFQPGYQDVFGNQDHHGDPLFLWVPSDTNDLQKETSLFHQTSWRVVLSEQTSMRTAFSYQRSRIQIQGDPARDLASLSAPTLIASAEPASLSLDRQLQQLQLKQDWTYRAPSQHTFKAGFHGQVSESTGPLSLQNRNGLFHYQDSSIGFLGGLYLQDDYRFHSQWVLNAGLRYDFSTARFREDHTRDALLQPRVGLNYFVADDWKLRTSYSRLFHSVPFQNLRAAFDFLNTSVHTYDIKPQKDHAFEVGSDYQFLPRQIWSLTLFGKLSENIVDESQLARTALSQPYNFKEGFMAGVETTVKGQLTACWSQFFNYTYSVGKGRGLSGGIWAGHFHGDPGAYFVLDHIQNHTANAGVLYSKDQWWASLQGTFGSGFRTGEQADVPLPSHLTWDISVGYRWHGLEIAGDLLNVLDNRYPITIANPFNGSRYAVGRQWMCRLTQHF